MISKIRGRCVRLQPHRKRPPCAIRRTYSTGFLVCLCLSAQSHSPDLL